MSNSRTAISIDCRLGAGDERSLHFGVLDGLHRPFKELPPKHFYDAEGSRLFEVICSLPEYYPTRAERSIIDAHAQRLVASTGVTELVELGSGVPTKTRLLLDAMASAGRSSDTCLSTSPRRSCAPAPSSWSRNTTACASMGSSATTSATWTRCRRPRERASWCSWAGRSATSFPAPAAASCARSPVSCARRTDCCSARIWSRTRAFWSAPTTTRRA